MSLQRFCFAAHLVFLIVLSVTLLSCGANTSVSSTGGPGPGPSPALTVTVSDPYVCSTSQQGPFQHIYVTITQVKGFTSPGTPDFSSGVNLTPNLNHPVQLDLLGTPTGCVLATLSNSAPVPAGTYWQFAVYLAGSDQVSRIPGGTKCGSTGHGPVANCQELADGTFIDTDPTATGTYPVLIPSSAVAGGQIAIASGSQTLNIDFDACASSLFYEGSFMGLDPTMHAALMPSPGQISGRVIDSSTQQSITGNVIIALEQPDTLAVDREILQTAPSSDGSFVFCPVPEGTFDVVAVGVDSFGASYGATITTGVQAGDTLGEIPLLRVSAGNSSPGIIQGLVTAAGPTGPGYTHIVVSALQQGTSTGTLFTVPLAAEHSTALRIVASPSVSYDFGIPAQSPLAGSFVAHGKTTYQQTAEAQYRVDVQSSCNPAVVSANSPLTATPGGTVSAGTIALASCPPE